MQQRKRLDVTAAVVATIAVTGRYTQVAVALHWLIALIIIANLVGGLTIEWFFDGAYPARVAVGRAVIGLHKAFGLLVLALGLVRLGWRLSHPPPPLPAYLTPVERRLAMGTHWLFYLLMLALPLSGWAMVSTRKFVEPVSLFGVLSVPPLPLPDAMAKVFSQSHQILGWVMVATLLLHMAAVVKHMVFDRDQPLGRMTLRL